MDHFALLAPFYDRIFSFLDPDKIRRLLALQGGEIVLDIGGGTGRVSQTLVETSKVVIVDQSLAMLKRARGKGMAVCLAKAEALPFAANSVERILVVDAFHHFGHQDSAASEMLRVLKANGRLLIEEPDISRLPVKLIALGERVLLMRSRFYSLEDLSEMFTRTGGVVSSAEGDRTSFRVVITKEG